MGRCMRWAALVALFSLAEPAGAQSDYEPYQPVRSEFVYLTLRLGPHSLALTLPDNRSIQLPYDSIASTNGSATVGTEVRFSDDGITWGSEFFPWSMLSDIEVITSDSDATLALLTRDDIDSPTVQRRKGNRILRETPGAIPVGDFVRGNVIAITGPVTIDGEVNKNVVCLFGDIAIGDSAVVRGSVVSVTGTVTLASNSRVYGSAVAGDLRQPNLRERFRQSTGWVTWQPIVGYDRVDGARVGLAVDVADPDTVLPRLEIAGAYAFHSEQPRLRFRVEQTVIRRGGWLGIGGGYRRELHSDDDWLLPAWENTLFSILVAEDFKDWYEVDGWYAYAFWHGAGRLIPFHLRVSYRRDDLTWRPAGRNLWSLFGANKDFRANFSDLPDEQRDIVAQGIDSTELDEVTVDLTWDERLPGLLFLQAAWVASIRFDHAVGGTLDYTRWRLHVRRYQPISDRLAVIARGLVGSSDGDLPAFRQFTLGGLGSLPGYRFKEYRGNAFWLGGAEGRLQLTRFGLALGLRYDLGTVAAEGSTSFEGQEVRQSAAVSIYLGPTIRLTAGRRLDSTDDTDLRFLVRLSHRW